MGEEGAVFAVPDQAALGGQDDLVSSAGDGPADDFFAVAVAVGGGGVDEGDSLVEGGMDGGQRLLVVAAAPHPAADGPGPQAHGGNLDPRGAQFPIDHGLSPESVRFESDAFRIAGNAARAKRSLTIDATVHSGCHPRCGSNGNDQCEPQITQIFAEKGRTVSDRPPFPSPIFSLCENLRNLRIVDCNVVRVGQSPVNGCASRGAISFPPIRSWRSQRWRLLSGFGANEDLSVAVSCFVRGCSSQRPSWNFSMTPSDLPATKTSCFRPPR